eukprot:2497440-Amphidinium_carterae.1
MGSIQCCCCESDGLSMSDVATPLAVEEDHRVMKKPVTVEVLERVATGPLFGCQTRLPSVGQMTVV